MVSPNIVKIPSLGTIDGARLMKLDDGDDFEIAGRRMNVFRPGTVELMTSVERGAQLITPKDASTIILECDIPSASTVIEVGAGSGALSIALLRSMPSHGILYTIELREDFAKKAKRNISRAGLADRWRCIIGDAHNTALNLTADAMVMDIPVPWETLAGADSMLRSGGRFCAYVPNTNQLEKTVLALRNRNYVEVRALENIQREMEVHAGGVRPSFEMLGHTGYLIFARKTRA